MVCQEQMVQNAENCPKLEHKQDDLNELLTPCTQNSSDLMDRRTTERRQLVVAEGSHIDILSSEIEASRTQNALQVETEKL